MAATKTKKSTEPTQEEMDQILEEEAIGYQTHTASIYLKLREVAQEIFGADKVSRNLLNTLADCGLPVDDEGDIDEDALHDLRRDLISAKAWALEVYGEDSPEAVLDAYVRGVNMDLEDEDEDEDDEDDEDEDE